MCYRNAFSSHFQGLCSSFAPCLEVFLTRQTVCRPWRSSCPFTVTCSCGGPCGWKGALPTLMFPSLRRGVCLCDSWPHSDPVDMNLTVINLGRKKASAWLCASWDLPPFRNMCYALTLWGRVQVPLTVGFTNRTPGSMCSNLAFFISKGGIWAFICFSSSLSFFFFSEAEWEGGVLFIEPHHTRRLGNAFHNKRPVHALGSEQTSQAFQNHPRFLSRWRLTLVEKGLSSGADSPSSFLGHQWAVRHTLASCEEGIRL